MKYGEELIRELEAEIERYENQMSRRWDRINNGRNRSRRLFRINESGRTRKRSCKGQNKADPETAVLTGL